MSTTSHDSKATTAEDTRLVQYPEHEKLAKITKESQAIADFLEATEYQLGHYVTYEGFSNPHFVPPSEPLEKILAKHFDIDLARIEQEKRHMLQNL